MAKIKTGLGKGLDLLITEDEDLLNEETDNPVQLKINEIEPNRDQPRKNFNREALEELASSIKSHGVIQPIIVRKKDGFYEIIAGERRWRAARIAGLKEIPAVIREYSDNEISEIALIENIQREDLTPVEEAKAYKALIEEYGITQEELSRRISKSRANIANTIRLLKLDEQVQVMLEEGVISAGHARALLGLEKEADQLKAAEVIAADGLSVRDAENLVKKWNKPENKKKKQLPENDFIYRDIEKKLTQVLAAKVRILNKNNKTGKIEIEYFSDEDLERIIEIINKGI